MALGVRKVAVLGAGVMGAQIAAHLVNADVPVVLFDLPAREGDPNGVARQAIDGLKKLSPPPLALRDRAGYIEPANYDQHLDKLGECDLVIEAIAERMDWKKDLYKRIAPALAPTCLIASNTSGLSLEAMVEDLPEALRTRFCGVHFFNPPRYMQLVELIPLPQTDKTLVDELESFLTSVLGKGVIRAFNTPNFIANRVGTFSFLSIIHHAEAFDLRFDAVDALTGPLIGRPSSATYRTMDVVGLDTLAHVIKTMADRLPDDPWHPFYRQPDWMAALIARGALGQKSGAGIYKRAGREILVLDLEKGDYVPSGTPVNPEVLAILEAADPAEKFARLRQSPHPQAQFLWAIFRDVFHYCAEHLGAIADNARDLDLALRWGFAWTQGPFEIWQSAGWQVTAAAIAADIDASKAMAGVALPRWVLDGRNGVHGAGGSYSATFNLYRPRSALAVYARQCFPEAVLGEVTPSGNTLFETDAVRMWTTETPGTQDIAILSFKTKMATLNQGVVEGVRKAISRAEADYKGLVIWQSHPPFSAGADLSAAARWSQTGDFAELDCFVAAVQQMTQALKYALVPTVAAVDGFALGGGCELVMHCTRAVCALESSIGLVEAGVGLVPGGGGLKEFAVRAAGLARRTPNDDAFPFLVGPFQAISMAKPAINALEAKEMGYLRDADSVLLKRQELLHLAQRTARALHDAGHRPRLRPKAVKVAGRSGIATFEATLVNMRDGGMISEHDYHVGRAIAVGLCGGEVETGSLVDEDWLLAVERRQFVELTKTVPTIARIKHMLETGKPLRN